VRAVPPPVAAVNGKTQGKIGRNELLIANKVTATLNNFYFQNVSYEITSFRCIYIPTRNSPVIAQDGGTTWSNQLIQYIQSARAGDRFLFESINSRGPGGVRYSLGTISLEIK
jgi:hypothetical protein